MGMRVGRLTIKSQTNRSRCPLMTSNVTHLLKGHPHNRSDQYPVFVPFQRAQFIGLMTRIKATPLTDVPPSTDFFLINFWVSLSHDAPQETRLS